MIKVYHLSICFNLLMLLLPIIIIEAQQQQDPMTLNGGCCLAMAGDGCVALVTDKRFGSGPQMVNASPRNVFIPHASLIVGFSGFHSDVQSLSHELELQVKSRLARGSLIHTNNELQQKVLMPSTMSRLMSNVLYSRRGSPYYVEPLIAGLMVEDDETNDEPKIIKPFLCAQDVIGAESKSNQFVCAGVASKSLYGTAEALWKPNLSPEELVEVCGKAFLSALERDCLSGYGAVLYLITAEDGIQQIELACRND